MRLTHIDIVEMSPEVITARPPGSLMRLTSCMVSSLISRQHYSAVYWLPSSTEKSYTSQVLPDSHMASHPPWELIEH